MRPSTAEVLLAKKQLKMEGVIRKLLVQQQEADCTIAELSAALDRLDPAEKDRIDLHDMTAAVRETKKGGPKFGLQHLNGAPQTSSLRRRSPWHIHKSDQDVVHAIHPDENIPTGRSSKAAQLEGRNVSTLVAPGKLFNRNSQWNITSSPNNNPVDILSFQDPEDRYLAPPIPKHLDSRKITESITKWGGDEQAEAWENSTARWQTHSEDVHGYTNFTPTTGMCKSTKKNPRQSRPNSAVSKGHSLSTNRSRSKQSRPASAVPTKCNTQQRLGDTDPELSKHPRLWTGHGYTSEVYKRLGQQNCEMHGRVEHDPELVPPKGF